MPSLEGQFRSGLYLFWFEIRPVVSLFCSPDCGRDSMEMSERFVGREALNLRPVAVLTRYLVQNARKPLDSNYTLT